MSAITAAEVKWKYSVKTGAAGNSTAQANPNASLGTYISTTEFTDGAPLFDDISGTENAAATVDYRCVFVHNTNASNTLTGAKAYISSEVAGGASIAIAADTTAASPVGQAAAQALTAASETAPGAGVTGLSFSSPTTPAAGIDIGDIPAGSCKAIWVRRTAGNNAALSGDGVTLAAQGSTGSL